MFVEQRKEGKEKAKQWLQKWDGEMARLAEDLLDE
jgi:hypothetical protein